MAYIKGIYKKCIYHNDDNLYLVGLIKIKETDLDTELIDKTITFTGNFTDILEEDNLVLNGEWTKHYKYGNQFMVKSYEKIIPDSQNGLVTFLSGGMFPGIGLVKAQKIVDYFKDATIDVIVNNPSALINVAGLSKNNIQTLHDKMLDYQENVDVIVRLNELGFTSKDSSFLYKKYKNKILDIINNNIYDLCTDDDNFYFTKIDALALKMHYEKDDKRRIMASICYIIKEVNFSSGDTFLYYDEIKNDLIKVLKVNINEELFDECLLELINNKQIYDDSSRYYLKNMYDAECLIARRLVYLNNCQDASIKNIDREIDALQNEVNITYNYEQLMAIKMALIKKLLIITGGPGTGKTTIIKAIVELYKKMNKLSPLSLSENLILLAPTGRASKRMMEAVNLPSQTIHRFLKWNKDTNKFGINEHNKSNAKIVIIDEFSMVDTYLFDSLLKGLKYDTTIILVGDYNQLPSVLAGQLLKDIIESNEFTCIKLESLYRQNENSNIITFAYDINNGIFNKKYFNILDDLTFIESDSYDLIDKLCELCMAYKDYAYNEFQIMAPMYKTLNGIDNLNVCVQNIFNPKDSHKKEILIGDTLYRVGDKVLQLVNMPDDNVYNGDIGLIDDIDNINKEIYIDFDGNVVKYNRSNWVNFKLGYVISIHKSQGSEFPVVVIPILNEYHRMLYRKLFYTGVTRAKKNLFLLGEEEAIKKAINTDLSLSRKTGLLDRIKEMYEEKSI